MTKNIRAIAKLRAEKRLMIRAKSVGWDLKVPLYWRLHVRKWPNAMTSRYR